MKPRSTFGLTAFFITASIASAQTQTDNLVTLTGNLKADYIVEMNANDRIAIAQGLEDINNMPAIEVDINSIYSEKDVTAFTLASKEVSRVLLQAAKYLVDMRSVVYKIDAALQHDKDGHFHEAIYQAYDKKFQSSFTSLLELFLGKDLTFNPILTAAMETCFTTSCVQDIANAQMDLINFGKSINYRVNLDSSIRWEHQNYHFKSRIVKDSVRITVDQVLKTNESESVYVKMLRSAAVPFVAAATDASETLSTMEEFVTKKNTARYQIAADPIVFKNKYWSAALKKFQAVVGENYDLILSQNNGAKAYAKPEVLVEQKATSLSTKEVKITDAFMKILKDLDIAFQKLTSLKSLDENLAYKMILESMYKYGKPTEAYQQLQLAAFAEGFQYAKDKNLNPSEFFEAKAYSHTLAQPISFVKDLVSTQYTTQAGYPDHHHDLGGIRAFGGLYINGGELFHHDSIDMFAAMNPKTHDIVQLFRLHSDDNEKLYFVIGLIDNPYRYLTQDENGNYRINLTVSAPLVEFSALK